MCEAPVGDQMIRIFFNLSLVLLFYFYISIHAMCNHDLYAPLLVSESPPPLKWEVIPAEFLTTSCDWLWIYDFPLPRLQESMGGACTCGTGRSARQSSALTSGMKGWSHWSWGSCTILMRPRAMWGLLSPPLSSASTRVRCVTVRSSSVITVLLRYSACWKPPMYS